MKTLTYNKTQTERNSHVIYMAFVTNPVGSVVTIGPASNEHELKNQINRSDYDPEKAERYQLFVPYPEGARRPKNEPAKAAN
jgi:3-deoxy-D-arabino-heptulosonate 7-phosphate (DAHP) synthase class II